MKKNLKKNNKGFTLIELLAVIVILGVLMIIAVPMVSKYIMEAKRNAFVATAKAYVSSARYAYLNGDYKCTPDIDAGTSNSVYIPFDIISVDKTGGKSSFNNAISKTVSYVVIQSNATTGEYTYYVRMVDDGGNGWLYGINEDKLEKKDVKTGIDHSSTSNLGKYTVTGSTSESSSAGSCKKQ